MRRLSHSGSIGYYTEMAAEQGLAAISMCQSDPMAVPVGGTEPYYGTNPISFSVPSADGRIVVFDMATTVQAWGKILDKRSRGESIPDTWAVDEKGIPVTDPNKVNALLPIAGAKGYGLMMMVDIFSGILTGVPFGGHVSSMYHDLSKGRDLGQLHIVIDPDLGWQISNRIRTGRGAHGFDPANSDMHTVFRAVGPDFKKSYKASKFRNVSIYPLVCKLLGIEPAPNDGDIREVLPMLR